MADFDSHLPQTGESGLEQVGENRPGWMDAIRDAADDPNWPPLPTMASGGGLPAAGVSGTGQGRPLRIRPRGVATGGMADLTGGKKPVTEPLQPTAVVQFHCPSCLTLLQVSQAELAIDVSCGSCRALVSPPRVLRK